MMQWIVSSSVLILVVIALRYVLRGKLSLRMQYALWLLVLVRLLVPVSFGARTRRHGCAPRPQQMKTVGQIGYTSFSRRTARSIS